MFDVAWHLAVACTDTRTARTLKNDAQMLRDALGCPARSCLTSYFIPVVFGKARSVEYVVLHLRQILHSSSTAWWHPSILILISVMQVDRDEQATRRSRRLLGPSSADPETTELALPEGCALAAGTFVVFAWNKHHCVLQANVTLYCWGRRRSGAIEHVLEKYGWTHMPQLQRINSALVTDAQWRWLKQIFLVVHRLFDDKETGETIGKVHWLNVMDCRLVYDLLLRECHHHRRNLYPKGSMLPSFLKARGVEVDCWPEWYSTTAVLSDLDCPTTPPPILEVDESNMLSSSGSSSASSSSERGTTILGDREWLSDVHIANLMFVLLHGQLELPLEMRDLFQYVYPITDQLLVQMLQRDEPGSLLMHAKTGGGVTLMFVNPSNNHWRLIVLDGVQQQVVMFDPLGTCLSSTTVAAVRAFVPSYHIVDLQVCLQAESWNCGVWTLYMASRYVTAVVAHLRSAVASSSPMQFGPCDDDQLEYAVLHEGGSASERRQNKTFAGELRNQYSTLLQEAQESDRLLYSSTSATDVEVEVEQETKKAGTAGMSVAIAGSALSASHGRGFINRPLCEQVWIDLADEVDAVDVEQEEEMEESYEELGDYFIEFREDNINSKDAASLRYSLPITLQSEVLQQQITEFRAYRRQRFSLFRRGPLVEETTISSYIKSLLRFLGYIHYEQSEQLQQLGVAGLDMSIFALPSISSLVLSYVEWLEQRRGNKPRAADDRTFQPVSCTTLTGYLNGLVSIVKFQLRHDIHLRDPLLDQLRNLRSQAESYSMTQKGFEKVHPQWCSWRELQVAREKCRAAFDQRDEGADEDARSYLLQLRETCLLCLLTICPPPRVSIIRLLEWDKTLIQEGEQGRWTVDLTDLAHAATRHKTHKRKGALRLPLPALLSAYLVRLRQLGREGAVFPGRSPSSFLTPTSFTHYVKTTFGKYTDNGRSPNPSLLRSIFTTWLYSLRYDTEDELLQQIKASSARWKAHSEQIAATVYNRELIYQHREFAVLLRFCEQYSSRFNYDGTGISTTEDSDDAIAPVTNEKRVSNRKRRSNTLAHSTQPKRVLANSAYVVDELVDVRVTRQGVKQVQVRWEGYARCTWEPYESIQEQLPDTLALLEKSLEQGPGQIEADDDGVRRFVEDYIATHRIDSSYRWVPDRLAILEQAAITHDPPIKLTVDQLQKDIMRTIKA